MPLFRTSLLILVKFRIKVGAAKRQGLVFMPCAQILVHKTIYLAIDLQASSTYGICWDLNSLWELYIRFWRKRSRRESSLKTCNITSLSLIQLGNWGTKTFDVMQAEVSQLCYLLGGIFSQPFSKTAQMCLPLSDHRNLPRTYISIEALQRGLLLSWINEKGILRLKLDKRSHRKVLVLFYVPKQIWKKKKPASGLDERWIMCHMSNDFVVLATFLMLYTMCWPFYFWQR